MNKCEAGQKLNGKSERRFYIQGAKSVLIVDRPVETHPNHKEIAQELIGNGLLASFMGLCGGYCISYNGELKYWGTTAGSIENASKTEFESTISTFGATIIP